MRILGKNKCKVEAYRDEGEKEETGAHGELAVPAFLSFVVVFLPGTGRNRIVVVRSAS